MRPVDNNSFGGPSNKGMRNTLIAATVLLTSLVALQTPALAQNNQSAELRLTVIDRSGSPVADALVTVYTIYGPRTVNADAKGVVVMADLPADTTQVWAGNLLFSGVDVTKLKAGKNHRTVTVRLQKPLEPLENDFSESGS